MEQRLIEIEIKLCRQEDMVESLNQVICQQQKKISQLEILCAALARQFNQPQDAGGGLNLDNERPPHY